MLTCLARPAQKQAVVEAMLLHTSTLGVREHTCRRTVLRSSLSTVDTPYGPICVKRSSGHGVAKEKPEYADVLAADAQIVEALRGAGAEYVVMAGYMRKVTSVMLDAFPNRVLNLHPALLPSFKGAHAIADAFNAGVKVTGVTVHFANADYDKGPIVAQRAIAVAENDTLDTLEAKIHDVEHVLYPEVIGLIAEGRVAVDPSTNKVHIS